jgi:molecular chaperone Hsp33
MNNSDHMVRILTDDGHLRATAAVTTQLVEEIRRLQQTDPTATVALGRLLGGAALLGSLLKGEQRLVLTVEGNGPLQKLHAETDATGHLRGNVKNPQSGLLPGPEGFPVAQAVGRAGFLHVIKDLGLKEPYRGMVMLSSSEIAEDLAHYLVTSEQIPSSVGLSVFVEEDGRVSAAGGFMVQAMPGAPAETIARLEERLAVLPPPTTLLRQGFTPARILAEIFRDLPYQQQLRTPLVFRCNCSRRQLLRLLWTPGADELRTLRDGEEEIVVTCEFCKAVYRFTAEELASPPPEGR